ncbi:DUF2267 domain-containing protein [Nostoc sp. LEGE 06077]|uniref:DUF2267 domain-containing protein n=1 Tax=Nostoc sp. LEGE 06077 TaxID=915325 RepID=UPI00187FB45E|nr:DUF2267 domain-containing protein [Nostoc sp. LEGE 06077]MBE9206046.1 DUF2267 domain-containing protein [Nostoc sp. LEGE 06077]
MEYHDFITHVQSLSQSNSLEEAELATRATLETIKERIADSDIQDLAAQLPQELSHYLQAQTQDSSQTFNLQEFIHRVSQKENIAPTTTAIHVRAVFAVLQNAINPEKFSRFQAHFSHDYEELFAAPPTSEVPA